eukprot:363259-Chlamydomonas_euryale.AAC.8
MPRGRDCVAKGAPAVVTQRTAEAHSECPMTGGMQHRSAWRLGRLVGEGDVVGKGAQLADCGLVGKRRLHSPLLCQGQY